MRTTRASRRKSTREIEEKNKDMAREREKFRARERGRCTSAREREKRYSLPSASARKIKRGRE